MAFTSFHISLWTAILGLLVVKIAAGNTNFTQCFNDFRKEENTQKYADYIYRGPLYNGVVLSSERQRNYISVHGCHELCSNRPGYYQWPAIASTITTWVLPIMGSLLQLPFESNQFWKTILAIIRWAGSPIASLSYVLWNIKVIGKCALLSDLSTNFDDRLAPRREKHIKDTSDVENKSTAEDEPEHMQPMREMRDSLYILAVMNQFEIKIDVDGNDAECLVRIALFAPFLGRRSRPYLDLTARRAELAQTLREGRKRGIVAVFMTLVWFLFALAISIEGAFEKVGINEIAHNLALGLLLAWFPVLVLSTVVDRNPVLTTTTRRKLNNLLEDVQISLRKPDAIDALYDFVEFKAGGKPPTDTEKKYFPLDWVSSQPAKNSSEGAEKVAGLNDQDQGLTVVPKEDTGALHSPGNNSEPLSHGTEIEIANDAAARRGLRPKGKEPALSVEFFQDFAGQGRIRWHYGIAHSILSGMEKIVLAPTRNPPPRKHSFRLPCSRGWLEFSGIVPRLIRGPEEETRLWTFDYREFWEIFSAFCIVAGALSGAFVVSYRTPTLGLGCRSGGYIIFGSIALGLLSFELVVWFLIGKPTTENARKRNRLNLVLMVGELVNFTWLVYIVLAQTIGSYQTCDCQSSLWGNWGGYIDTSVADLAFGVKVYWIVGTLLSTLIMFSAIAFLVVEWCEQSHLNSEDLTSAANGLDRTRRFKRRTLWLRQIPTYCIILAKRAYQYLVEKSPPLESLVSIHHYWVLFRQALKHGHSKEDGQDGQQKKGDRGRKSVIWSFDSAKIHVPPVSQWFDKSDS